MALVGHELGDNSLRILARRVDSSAQVVMDPLKPLDLERPLVVSGAKRIPVPDDVEFGYA